VELVSEPAVLTGVREAGARGRVLTFVTRGRGAVRVFARRLSRREPSRSFFEPLQGGELSFLLPADGGPGRLFTFVPQRVWPGIRADFARTVHAVAFLETVNLFLTEGEPQPGVFALLLGFLNRLEGDASPAVARALATARLLVLEGFGPELGACVSCRAPITGGTVTIDPDQGGALCAACLARTPGRGGFPQLSAGAHGFLARAIAIGEGQLWRIRASQGVVAEVQRALEALVEARTGTRPRSHDFFAKLRGRGVA